MGISSRWWSLICSGGGSVMNADPAADPSPEGVPDYWACWW